jgi:hypothetical protein
MNNHKHWDRRRLLESKRRCLSKVFDGGKNVKNRIELKIYFKNLKSLSYPLSQAYRVIWHMLPV